MDKIIIIHRLHDLKRNWKTHKDTSTTRKHSKLKYTIKLGISIWIRLQYNENVEFFQYNKSLEMIAFVSGSIQVQKNENK